MYQANYMKILLVRIGCLTEQLLHIKYFEYLLLIIDLSKQIYCIYKTN